MVGLSEACFVQRKLTDSPLVLLPSSNPSSTLQILQGLYGGPETNPHDDYIYICIYIYMRGPPLIMYIKGGVSNV